MTETKIFCDADCKYNKGHCTHPDNQHTARYGGIDRCYVEKCDLLVQKVGYRFGRGNGKLCASFEKFLKFVLENKGGETE